MKLHFEPDLDYQLHAIEAVCELFRGQEICRTEFTVTRDPADTQMRLGFAQTDLGIGNRLTLLDDELLKNLSDVQIRNGLAPAGFERILADQISEQHIASALAAGVQAPKAYGALAAIHAMESRDFGFFAITPAQMPRFMSGSSSIGGPVRTFAEHSSIGTRTMSVASISLSSGWRACSQRPGTMCSTTQRMA